MIPCGWHVQKRQIYRHTKQSSGCLRLGVGVGISSKWAPGNFVEWWKSSQTGCGDGCTMLWYINYILIKLLKNQKQMELLAIQLCVLPILAEAFGFLFFTSFLRLKLIKNILSRVLKDVLQTYRSFRSCLKFDTAQVLLESHLDPSDSGCPVERRVRAHAPKPYCCAVSLTERSLRFHSLRGHCWVDHPSIIFSIWTRLLLYNHMSFVHREPSCIFSAPFRNSLYHYLTFHSSMLSLYVI